MGLLRPAKPEIRVWIDIFSETYACRSVRILLCWMVGVGYLLPMNQRDESTVVVVDGKSLRLTHLSQVMFPDDGYTKTELLLYS